LIGNGFHVRHAEKTTTVKSGSGFNGIFCLSRNPSGPIALHDSNTFPSGSLSKATSMANVFVEPRPKGRHEGDPITGYVVEDHADSVLHTATRQQDAIEWAKKNGHSPLVARVRHLNDKKVPDHWRSV
jgi:hypothetical protein